MEGGEEGDEGEEGGEQRSLDRWRSVDRPPLQQAGASRPHLCVCVCVCVRVLNINGPTQRLRPNIVGYNLTTTLLSCVCVCVWVCVTHTLCVCVCMPLITSFFKLHPHPPFPNSPERLKDCMICAAFCPLSLSLSLSIYLFLSPDDHMIRWYQSTFNNWPIRSGLIIHYMLHTHTHTQTHICRA